MSIGLFCTVALLVVLVLGGLAVLALQVMFSPARAVVGPCSLSDFPGMSPTPGQVAVQELGFPTFEPFGPRALLRSFESLGFQMSGAVVVQNPPVPDVYVALLTRPDADARLWVQPDGTPADPSTAMEDPPRGPIRRRRDRRSRVAAKTRRRHEQPNRRLKTPPNATRTREPRVYRLTDSSINTVRPGRTAARSEGVDRGA